MTDKFSINHPYQKRAFISKLNPESPPFQPSSFYQHIQEVSQPKPTLENYNNHLHIQSVTNGFHDNHNYSSTIIHPAESTEHQVSHPHYIEETMPNGRQSTRSTHFEPVNVSWSDDLFETTTNTHNDEVLNHEEKAQRELDEEEIPPAELSLDESSTHIETTTSYNEPESNIDETRPLTELESPYEQHTVNELSTSLPDVVAETLEQNESDDVLGNKSLLKQTITPGTLDTRPFRDTLATVSYKLYLVDNLTEDSRLIETITNESFIIGEYDILPAIDIVIQLMDRSEHALIDSDVRHCYGENGCEEKQIPPITSTNSYRMKIDLELVDWTDAPDIPTLSVNERLNWSDKKRQRGNFCYRRKDYSSALHCYRNALKYLDVNKNPLMEEEENQSSNLTERYIQVQNNLAQVYLFNNQYEQCLEAVDAVLKHDSQNIKALFRQGKALVELGNYDQALRPLKLLLQSSSKDVEKDKVTEMLNICETKLAKYKKNEKEIYQKMFQSKTATTTVEEKKLPTKPVQKVETKTNNNTNWLTYVAMGSAVVAAMGLAAIIKYR
ncbi:hypothetical protein I4U23_011909 [Adineta vaga]|nr:hypothetical protein I4U23_011909 [Adineta vaga]